MDDEDLKDDLPGDPKEQLVRIADEVITTTVINKGNLQCVKAVKSWIKQYAKQEVTEIPPAPKAPTLPVSPPLERVIEEEEVIGDETIEEEVTGEHIKEAMESLETYLGSLTDVSKRRNIGVCNDTRIRIEKLYKKLLDRYHSSKLANNVRETYKDEHANI